MRRAWVVACGLLSAAVMARSAPVTVSPTEGGIGQNVVLAGYGFAPVKAPKVVLVPQPGQTARRKVTLKPFAFATDRIDVAMTAGAAGIYDVTVVPKDKGVAPVTLPQSYTILVPEPASADPVTGPVKIPVAILGSRFGTTKGKVTIGRKKAKVTRWEADRIEVVVPKSLKPGVHAVVVTNKAGASTAAVSFTVAGGSGASDRYFRFDAGTVHFATTKQEPIYFNANHNVSQGFLAIGASAKPNGLPSLTLTVNGPQLATPTPYDVVVGPTATGALGVTFAADGNVYTAGISSNFKLTVTGYAEGVLTGTFGGDLTRLAGTGPTTVTVENGEVRVLVGIVGQ